MDGRLTRRYYNWDDAAAATAAYQGWDSRCKTWGYDYNDLSFNRGVNCLYCRDDSFRTNSGPGYWFDSNNCDNACRSCGGCSCGGSCSPCGCSDIPVYYFTCGKLIYIKNFIQS